VSRRQRNVSLAPDAEHLLAEIGEGGSSASAYLSELVRDAERRWRRALALLRTAGWVEPELLAAFDALNGWGLVEQPPTWAGQTMADTDPSRWDVSPERWMELAGRVAGNEREAQAIVDLAAEFWRMNPRVERAVGRVDG